MAVCHVCGSAISDPNAVVCSNCGSPVSAEGALPKRPSPSGLFRKRSRAPKGSDSSTPFAPPPVPSRGGHPQAAPAPKPARKGFRLGKVALFAALLVFLALAAGFFAMTGADGETGSGHSDAGTSAGMEIDGEKFSSRKGLTTGSVDSAAADLLASTPAPKAIASAEQIVFLNSDPEAVITVDGVSVPFTCVGSSAIVDRSYLPAVCQVRIITPVDGGYQTASVWFNEQYAASSQYNYAYTFGDANDYGAYQTCDESGLCRPSDQMINVLTWAYYKGFLRCINDQTLDSLVYSTAANTERQAEPVFSSGNADYTYDLNNFLAVCSPESIQYSDGVVVYNASFRSYGTARSGQKTIEVQNHRTIELIYEDGLWKVNRIAFLSDDDFNAGRYANLP